MYSYAVARVITGNISLICLLNWQNARGDTSNGTKTSGVLTK
ncbi:hypothetical protein [Arcicella rigui]|uniref:Uncharacterized protein n=1 Tax=Arcicella rigui TaxID=797020 RepID=A0ABU5QCN2_9BACT|nr:hypothetical protein [Arcicella rigui]MEA5140368.1 hypothetical protein [Arcicella rigui]